MSKREETNPRIRSAMLQLDKLQTAAAVGDEAAATSTTDPAFAVELATAIVKRANGKGKQLLIGLLMVIIGPGGVVAAYYALRDDVTKATEHIAQPMHDGAAKQLDKLDDRLGDVETKVEAVVTGQGKIVTAVEGLRQEKIDAIIKERDELRDKLDRQPRHRPRRDRERDQ